MARQRWAGFIQRAAWPLLTAAVLLLPAACGSGPAAPQGQSSASLPRAELPAGLFVDRLPDGALGVVAAKAQAEPGKPIVVRGRIGGSAPFAKGRASMSVYDLALPTCNEHPADSCPTPWDYCCETKEARIANAASIQVLGPDGQVLAANLEGAHGLAPLDHVVVRGVVASNPPNGSLIVNALAIHVEKRAGR